MIFNRFLYFCLLELANTRREINPKSMDSKHESPNARLTMKLKWNLFTYWTNEKYNSKKHLKIDGCSSCSLPTEAISRRQLEVLALEKSVHFFNVRRQDRPLSGLAAADLKGAMNDGLKWSATTCHVAKPDSLAPFYCCWKTFLGGSHPAL